MSATTARGPAVTGDSLAAVLEARLVGFLRYARHHRFNVGLQQQVDAQRLACFVDVTDGRRLRRGLKALLCTSAAQWQRFDAMFDRYFEADAERADSRVGYAAATRSRLREMTTGNLSDEDSHLLDAKALDEEGGAINGGAADTARAGASLSENPARVNFNELRSRDELERLEDMAERWAKRIRRRLLRRQRVQRRGARLDVRQTLRASLHFGGLPLKPVRRNRRQQLPKLVLILDVSRSMSLYSLLFLRFARGLLDAFKHADAFAFHTRLVPIGDTLREPDVLKLAEKLALVSAGWHGGTRIGDALETFNREHAARVLNSRATVVIVSDGYDTGEPEWLAAQLRQVARRARRVVWLNPLLGVESYSPVARCMQAALPYVDVFASAHDLQSLADLEVHLGRM